MDSRRRGIIFYPHPCAHAHVAEVKGHKSTLTVRFRMVTNRERIKKLDRSPEQCVCVMTHGKVQHHFTSVHSVAAIPDEITENKASAECSVDNLPLT